MGTHTRRAFINSCLKTPIDPCNNCPAPIYNRPKIYLGRLNRTTPPRKTIDITENSEDFSTRLWSNSSIRSLSKLYESIPDYCDINHLTEKEFYSTMDSLRSTCRELKTKPIPAEESSNTSIRSQSTVCKTKSTKKKLGSSTKSASKKKSWADPKVGKEKADPHPVPSNRLLEIPQLKSFSYKQEFEAEVEAFKKTIRDYENELKCRAASRYLGRAKSSSFLATLDSPKSKVDEITQTEPESACVPPKPTRPNLLGVSLRKSFSSNDINSVIEFSKDNFTTEETTCQKSSDNLTEAERLSLKDKKRLKNYFTKEKTKTLSPPATELPIITVHSPSSEVTSSNPTFERYAPFLKKKKSSKKKIKENPKIPFKIFELGNNSEKKNHETSSAEYPVARPNLAAKLRAEVSKKKLKELHNNCTYHDETPQCDWEVRKTPAWRLLSLNETHEEILALRLAKRKAEQALQQREYELNMLMMKQRVKSAPLLLEGTTFWGPNVGKLTHSCQNDSQRHTCDSLKRKQRKKVTAGQNQCHNKLNELQKIYGSSGKASSQSRNSQRSAASTQRRKGKQKQPSLLKGNLIQTSMPCANESGDELSSLDRAFL